VLPQTEHASPARNRITDIAHLRDLAPGEAWAVLPKLSGMCFQYTTVSGRLKEGAAKLDVGEGWSVPVLAARRPYITAIRLVAGPGRHHDGAATRERQPIAFVEFEDAGRTLRTGPSIAVGRTIG